MRFDEDIWKAQRGTAVLEQDNPRSGMLARHLDHYAAPGDRRDAVLAGRGRLAN